jgi:uncharacterized protein YkwD
MLRRRHVLAVMALTAAIAAGPGAGGAAGAVPCPNEATVGTLLDVATFERTVVCLVNRERTSRDRRPVRPNLRLRRAASRYAARMVAEGFFAHVSPSGSSILSRLEAVGYPGDAVEWEVGENLIWASGTSSTPAALVEGWMLSPGHRENLLRPVFREIGVGVALGTPQAPTDPAGLTVASEYGVRAVDRPRGEGKGKSDEKGKSGAKDRPGKPKKKPKR